MVTIIGGGIAGCVLAGALARREVPVTLYEQQKGHGAGNFLFIDGRGHDVLTSLGCDRDRLHEASFSVVNLAYADSSGRSSEMPSGGHRFWQRGALMDVLTEFVADSGAQLHYGRSISQFVPDGPAAALHCDGDLIGVEDDLVIGADGINSVVRAGIEPDRVPEYAGDVVVYGETTEPVELDSDPAILHFFAEIGADGSNASTFGHIWRPGDPSAFWFLRVARPALDDADDLGRAPMENWAETVLSATPSTRKFTDTLLQHTSTVHVSNARNVPLDTAADPALPFVLIGDADHAISPAAGVGAREALEDVQALYRAITSGTSSALAMAERRVAIAAERTRAQRNRSVRPTTSV